MSARGWWASLRALASSFLRPAPAIEEPKPIARRSGIPRTCRVCGLRIGRNERYVVLAGKMVRHRAHAEGGAGCPPPKEPLRELSPELFEDSAIPVADVVAALPGASMVPLNWRGIEAIIRSTSGAPFDFSIAGLTCQEHGAERCEPCYRRWIAQQQAGVNH